MILFQHRRAHESRMPMLNFKTAFSLCKIHAWLEGAALAVSYNVVSPEQRISIKSLGLVAASSF
jgi:hypothetical protein